MTIKAQTQTDPQWWPLQVRRRVMPVLPDGVDATVIEDPMRCRLDVFLSESWARRAARWLGLARMSRSGVMVRVLIELADAPAGLAVGVRWV